jgi:hypothetical protein
MLMGVTSWELGVLRVPLIMVPDNSRPIFIKYEINTDSIRIKTESRKTGRNKPPLVSYFYIFYK